MDIVFAHYFLEAPYAHKQSVITAADFSLYLVAQLQETAQCVVTLGSLPVPDNPVPLY